MKKYASYFKNKYSIASLFVVLYILILHDADIFTLLKRHERITLLEDEIVRKKNGIKQLKQSIDELENIRSLEKYAREEHYFKKDNEDIFIFSFE